MRNADKVRLVAYTDIPTLDVTILDDRFQFVHRSVGTVDVELPPGNYLLQYQAGSTVTEEAITLRPGETEHVLRPPVMSTRSPIPLSGSNASRRYGDFARDTSRQIHERHGTGGELFLMIRTSTTDLQKDVSSDALFAVRLLDADRRLVVDLREAGRSSDDGAARACGLELTPGSYLLRYGITEADELEQTIVVSSGWQTQIFASSRPYGESQRYGPNLPEAGVMMVPIGEGFNADNRNAVIAESARLALAASCPVAPEVRLKSVTSEANAIRASTPHEELAELLRAKFRNPIVGIYGAHLLLIGGNTNWDLVRGAVTMLKTLIGPHPDVQALTGLPQLKDLADDRPHDLPPMLRNSWTLLVGHSAESPETLPGNSYAAGIANRLWGSHGWLVWHPPAARRPAAARTPVQGSRSSAPPTTVDAALTTIRQKVTSAYRTVGFAGLIRSLATHADLTDTERAILLYFIRAVHQGRDLHSFTTSTSGFFAQAATKLHDWLEHQTWADGLTGGLTLAPLVLEQLKKESLVRALGVPAAALDESIVALATKLANAAAMGAAQEVTRSPLSG